MKPMAPVARNAACQPQFSAIHGTSNGATMAPALLPALNNPTASARSFAGNHDDTALSAPGKFPASPRPNNARAAAKPATVRANACAIAAALHATIAMV